MSRVRPPTAAVLTAIVIAALAVGCGSSAHKAGGSGSTVPPRVDPSAPTTTVVTPFPTGTSATDACPCPNLAPGSKPSTLPAPVLVADHMNNRLLVINPNGSIAWEFPRPGDLQPGQTFDVPDDAFFTPDGNHILVTQEDDQVISLVDVAHRRIVWTYGSPGNPGLGPNQLNHPDDAMMTPNGDVILADIKNCRVLVLRPGHASPLRIYGETTNACYHSPPQRWGSPNGAFPLSNGNYIVTEINGDWVDGLTLGNQITFTAQPPSVYYPSDTNEVSPGVYLTVDYSNPGQIVEFNQAGGLIWRFAPTGAAAMNKPSLALPLRNGDILANDDFNDRVIVVDPGTNQVVWQYGHIGTNGTGPGYLNDPDGVDLVPPWSLTISHRATMGEPPTS